MEINFNVHGQQRKKLVEQIAEYTQQKAEYQYTPTYAYQIANTLSARMAIFYPQMRFLLD
jgi:hypothetical protein